MRREAMAKRLFSVGKANDEVQAHYSAGLMRMSKDTLTNPWEKVNDHFKAAG